MEGCAVNECNPSDVPQCWEEEEQAFLAHAPAPGCAHDSERALSAVNGDLTVFEQTGIANVPHVEPADIWTVEDATVHDPKAVYYNLHLNPERFTAYKGFGARRVWQAIYEENCFTNPAADSWATQSQCNEKRVFYRLISGLHTSITCHLIYKHYDEASKIWAPNFSMWRARMLGKREFLENLFFTYLAVLRAVQKATPFLDAHVYLTGNASEDARTQALVQRLTASLGSLDESCPHTFDESTLFHGPDAAALRRQFSRHFHNISRIMDCVECTKCRLWGKIQVNGLGAALKVLFEQEYNLSRTEIIALVWLLHQLSHSLRIVDAMRQLEVDDRLRFYAIRGAAAVGLVGAVAVLTVLSVRRYKRLRGLVRAHKAREASGGSKVD